MLARCVLLASLGGCNWLYGLESTQIIDAAEFGIDAPPDLDDEDLDTVANEFDNCPGIPNRDQADSDGDTVGNVCDPNEMTSEKIVGRYMFNRPAIDRAAWNNSGWEFRDGYAEVTSSEATTLVTKQVHEGAIIFIEARFAPTAIDTSQYNEFSIAFEGLAGPRCSLSDSVVQKGLFVSPGIGAPYGVGFDLFDNVPVTLRGASYRRLPTQIGCAIGSIGIGLDYPGAPPDAIVLGTLRMPVRVEYVVVYATATASAL